jgi:hypothetical protein
MLKPWDGELEIYPVNPGVGKVGNNSPSFIIPLDQNKGSLANFFASQKKAANSNESKQNAIKAEGDVKIKGLKVEQEDDENRETIDAKSSETNAPLPTSSRGIKRGHGEGDDIEAPHDAKTRKISEDHSQSKPSPSTKGRSKSSTTNSTIARSSPKKAEQGTQRITKFFGK